MSVSGNSVMTASLMRGKLRETSSGEYDVDDDSRGVSESSIDFLKDDVKEMTFSRRIALYMMKRYAWYNPHLKEGDEAEIAVPKEEAEEPQVPPSSPVSERSELGDFERKITEKPSLEKAWAYFEHVALDRYLVEEKEKTEKKPLLSRIVRKFQKGDKKLEKAEPGEKDLKTRLYDPIFTPHAQLGDFGLGIGLYFSTLRAITVITFIAGLVSVYNIWYFAGDIYSFDPSPNATIVDNGLLRGSAICTLTTWVPCPNCTCTDGSQSLRENLFENRCAEGVSAGKQNLTFVLRNDCDGTPWQLGAVNYATVIIMLLSTIMLGEYLRRQEVQFDEDEQTAQDYSICISNPPPDAVDPDEWFDFFKENFNGAHVTVCTCAVDNDFLIRTLVERREILRKIQYSMEPGTSMRRLDLAHKAAKEEQDRNWLGRTLALLSPGLPEWYSREVALSAKVQGLSQLDYPVTNIFITFETEKDQRFVLEKLSVGSLKSHRNDLNAVSSPRYLFRGKHVLAVSEPDEPNTIRWQDLNATWLQMLKEQVPTALATFAAIVAVAVVVRIAKDASPLGAAISISVFNSVFPIFAKMLTDMEAHASDGERQRSLYAKIALFRWVNTSVVFTIVTPFTDTLADGALITQVYALFFAEIVTVSAIQLIDPMGHVKRHFLAPRAVTTDAMNLNFQGTEFELAERYTDMTKLLFLCLWYCSIFPGAFFFCSFALLVKYFADRFSLMRTWKRAPQLGTRVSKFSRRYFFSLACVAMAVMSSFYWSGFPFDNICLNDTVDPNHAGSWKLYPSGDEPSTPVDTSVDESDMYYRFCNQNLLMQDGWSFPFVPDQQPIGGEWMTDEQEALTRVFGWSALAITILVVIQFIWGWVDGLKGLFTGTFEAVGEDQGIPFSSVSSRSSYVPQVVSPLFSYPLIACNSDDIDPELYEWSDPDRPYSFYDLTNDATELLKGIDVSANVGFTRIKHYPPQDVAKESEAEEKAV